ncbi:MAG: hypothetical protein ABI670_04565 [Chloroflexota bacterium]
MKNKPYYRLVLAFMPAIIGLLLLPGMAAQGSDKSGGTAATGNGKTNVEQQVEKVRLPKELVARAGQITTGRAYSGYVKAVDSYSAITVDLPKEWTQVESGDWIVHGKPVGRFIAASTDLQAFYNTGAVPGVYFAASSVVPAYNDLATAPDVAVSAGTCKNMGVFDYQDTFYQGAYNYYADCGKGASNLLVLNGAPGSQDFMTSVRLSIRSKEDLDAAAHILATFQVVGRLDADNHSH